MNRIIACMIALALSTTPLAAQDIPLSKILVEKEGWREVAKFPRVTVLGALASGNIIIHDGQPLGMLEPTGKVVNLAVFMAPRDQRHQTDATTRAGVKYEINLPKKSVTATIGMTIEPLKLSGLVAPTCLALWPDEGHLVIGEADGAYLWAVRIEKDGSLGPGDRYYSLRTKPNEKMHVTAMTMDAGYLLYACTTLGIQVFDPTGRLSGVIGAPSKEPMTAITIGGETADTLFVAGGDRIYARRIQGKAIYALKKER